MREFEYTEEIVRIRRTIRVRRRIVGEPMEICLCSRCASQFYNSPNHFIKRVNPYQTVKELCTYCNHRYGYDFLIYDLEKEDASE